MIIPDHGIYKCVHCGGKSGDFYAETGNHVICQDAAEARAENERLREALEFYASIDDMASKVFCDGGEIARAALKESESI